MTTKQLRRTANSKTPPILGLLACSAFLLILTGCVTITVGIDKNGVTFGASIDRGKE